MSDVDARVRKTVRATFELDASEKLEKVAYKEHPRWDSLGHIQLVLALEKEFRIKFSSEEVLALKNVAAVEAVIRKKAV
jgi:acyl carrier protein